MKALDFIISAEFGIFRVPHRIEPSLTFSFIPKSAVLGVCGAILGLAGYAKRKQNPEFLEKLSCFKVAVAPLTKTNTEPSKANVAPYPDWTFASRPFRRSFVKFINFHGYGNVDGPGIYTEQLLIRPAYLVTLLADDGNKEFSELEKMLESKRTVFRPYLGKNEFLANVEFKGVSEAHGYSSEQPFKCDSIYPVSFSFVPPEKNTAKRGTFKILDDYAFSVDSNCKHKQRIFCFTESECYANNADLSVGKFYLLNGARDTIVFAF